MTDKAYIVANKQQELDVLKKFEENGLFWEDGEKPTEWVPSETAFGPFGFNFPYVLSFGSDGNIVWLVIENLEDETVVYDGRKEDEEVDTRYKVTQKFMNGLIKWRDDNGLETEAVDGDDIQRIPDVVDVWWTDPHNSIERNNRLIAIVQWLNGEDVFEVEQQHKFVVRSEKNDDDGEYTYVFVESGMPFTSYYFYYATKFDTREEAQEWANSHQVVVEIDEDGNEVE